MHEFKFSNGELFCEDLNVAEFSSSAETPFYLYSRKTLEDHYRKIEQAFSRVDPVICYSLKANSNLEICRVLAGLGAGADIVSGGELFKALAAGMPPSKTVYAGVGKTAREVAYALDNDILMFNVESEGELALIDETARECGKTARVALRLNPDIKADTHEYITTGSAANKFGMDQRTVERLMTGSAGFPNVDMAGIHIHIGSQMIDLGPYTESVRNTAAFMEELKKKGVRLEWLNIGGGLGIKYSDEEPSTAEEFAERVLPLLERTGLKIIMEPGRFIAGNAGILVSGVVYVKKSRGKNFVIVDAGMNDLFRPALYGAYHDIQPVRARGKAGITADVVGPICESGDFFAKDRTIPAVRPGDRLAIFGVGAYGYSMASNYNARPRPAEFLVEGGMARSVRHRENYIDLVDTELLKFTKMCGSGNDFIMVDNRHERYTDRAGITAALCRRRVSAGADGIIFLESGRCPGALRMRIFNADGSEAEMCGNGARCLAAFAYRLGLLESREAVFETGAGPVEARIIGPEEVRLKMPEPSSPRKGIKLEAGEREVELNSVTVGVPHAVLLEDDLENADVEGLGRRIREHEMFKPAGTNVDFVRVAGPGRILVRTYERGVEAETLACGTGACASAVVCHLLGKVSPPVEVVTRGGSILKVLFSPGESPGGLCLEGDARFVYDAAAEIPAGRNG